MKTIIAICVLALGATPAPALAETIQPTDAQAHVGQTATIEGTVSEVHFANRSETTFIDFVGNYPNNAFTAVIFKEDAAKFPSVEGLTGKTVDVTGSIDLYKGKPEIILRSADQLKPH
ncbi:MAG: hypothetical protein WBD95_13400 [Xanthobacteraceae bacterium]